VEHRRNHRPKSGGDKARPEGPKLEDPRSESGGGVLGAPHRLGGLGVRCKLPQRGSGQSPEKNGFWCIFGLNFAVFHALSGQNMGGRITLASSAL